MDFTIKLSNLKTKNNRKSAYKLLMMSQNFMRILQNMGESNDKYAKFQFDFKIDLKCNKLLVTLRTTVCQFEDFFQWKKINWIFLTLRMTVWD